MTTPSASAESEPHRPRNSAGNRLLLTAAAAAGPMTGTAVVLLGKPLGGAVGLPGAVAGYITLTAAVLAALAVLPAWRWRVLGSGRRAGAAALAAGGGTVLAGLIPQIPALTAGLLVTGLCAGPLLATTHGAAAGPRGYYGSMALGALAGAALAEVYVQNPQVPLVISGCVAAGAGLAVAVLNPPVDGFGGGFGAVAGRVRRTLSIYAATGFAVGATVLPALHLLLFRWNVLDADQPVYVVAAVAVALPVAWAGGGRAVAPAPLLVLAAGGAILVATAPGPWQLAIGIAVTVTAAVRCQSCADSVLRRSMSSEEAHTYSAVTATALACGGFAGLGCAVGAGHLWGTGTALTVLAVPVLVVALFTTRSAPTTARRSAVSAAPAATTLEGGAR